MSNAKDVARYILDQKGEMTAMKLQKLTYYSKAWHLVWEDKALFSEPIQAWANGPVCPALYQEHRGMFQVAPEVINGDTSSLTEGERTSIDSVLEFYGERSAHELSELTHMETPWLDAREGLVLGAVGDKEITDGSMSEYYGSLI